MLECSLTLRPQQFDDGARPFSLSLCGLLASLSPRDDKFFFQANFEKVFVAQSFIELYWLHFLGQVLVSACIVHQCDESLHNYQWITVSTQSSFPFRYFFYIGLLTSCFILFNTSPTLDLFLSITNLWFDIISLIAIFSLFNIPLGNHIHVISCFMSLVFKVVFITFFPDLFIF